MSISQLLESSITWLAWTGLGLAAATLISFFINWGAKFRLVGATIFTFLLSGSCWAFSKSYSPPFEVEGALYAPIVYDNGFDLVVAQVPQDFPNDAIQPTLKQIAGNLRGGGRNGSTVHVRIRKLDSEGNGATMPIILGEVVRDINKNTTTEINDLAIINKEQINPEDGNQESIQKAITEISTSEGT